ncbi:MAG: DUF3127 domain-containing protein [Opitutales bacterium]|nr:DUF3127 domain-containing protein [Opitutales bacterium]
MPIFPRNQVIAGSTSSEKVVKQYLHEITGKLDSIEDAILYGSGFKIRKFVVTSDDRIPQPIVFQLIGDKVDLVENIATGSSVKIVFRITGRRWEGKLINNLEVQSIDIEAEKEQSETEKKQPDATSPPPRNNLLAKDDEEIPF